jgi:hypothetical protein
MYVTRDVTGDRAVGSSACRSPRPFGSLPVARFPALHGQVLKVGASGLRVFEFADEPVVGRAFP